MYFVVPQSDYGTLISEIVFERFYLILIAPIFNLQFGYSFLQCRNDRAIFALISSHKCDLLFQSFNLPLIIFFFFFEKSVLLFNF